MADDNEILVVGESPIQVEELRYILEKHDITVSTAVNGREALDVIARRRPSMIISDIMMPEMDGYELCRKVKTDATLRGIPIVLLTALSDPQDLIRGMECGADSFITKPYDEEYLISAIRQMQTDRFYPLRENSAGGLELNYGGRDYVLNADRGRILKLLLSSYETAIRKNRELSRARDEMEELNDQLKAANNELESFSFTVSHDLRSPLNVICLYGQLIIEMAGGGDPQIEEYTKGILGQVERMNQLISTLLNFSQLTRGEMTRVDVDLSRTAREIADHLSMKQPERDVTFRIADGIVVFGDARLLRVVLENLLGNAWKYTGGKAEACIEFGMTDAGRKPVYFVRDNGAGFDMGQVDSLFKPFRRLHGETEFEGTGIGLAIVRRIIERHGGKVWAEGDVGKGAAFYFTL